MTGIELREIRNALGLTQTEFGEKLSVSRVSVTRYEKADEVPETIGKLAKMLHNDTIDQDSVREPDAIWVNYESFMMVPLVTKRARAGFMANWEDEEYVDDLPKVPWEVDKEYKGKYLTFEVVGDSMTSEEYPYDSIFEGDLLLCREVQRHHWKNGLHINQWDFIIVHREEGILAKRITNQNIGTGELTLHSLNSQFEDQIVSLNDVMAIYNIIDVKRNRKRR